MINEYGEFKKEVFDLFVKVLIPAVVAVGIKLAIQMKTDKVTIMSAFASLVIGVGFAFLSAGVIRESFNESWQTIVIGLVAIVGEKVGYWLIYKFKFDKIGEALIESVIKAFKK